MSENIMESNKMIADFMRLKCYNFRGHNTYVFSDNNHRTEIDLHYHSDWNWLMPVIEKIDNIKGFTLKSFTLEAHENDNDKKEYCCILEGTPIFESYSFKSSIDAVYSAIIKFITWYNQNTKTKSKACSNVLQLIDRDFTYQEALSKILSDNKELSKTELEKELNLYI